MDSPGICTGPHIPPVHFMGGVNNPMWKKLEFKFWQKVTNNISQGGIFSSTIAFKLKVVECIENCIAQKQFIVREKLVWVWPMKKLNWSVNLYPESKNNNKQQQQLENSTFRGGERGIIIWKIVGMRNSQTHHLQNLYLLPQPSFLPNKHHDHSLKNHHHGTCEHAQVSCLCS